MCPLASCIIKLGKERKEGRDQAGKGEVGRRVKLVMLKHCSMRGEKGFWTSFFSFLVLAQFCCSDRTSSGASNRRRKAPLQRSE